MLNNISQYLLFEAYEKIKIRKNEHVHGFRQDLSLAICNKLIVYNLYGNCRYNQNGL